MTDEVLNYLQKIRLPPGQPDRWPNIPPPGPNGRTDEGVDTWLRAQYQPWITAHPERARRIDQRIDQWFENRGDTGPPGQPSFPPMTNTPWDAYYSHLLTMNPSRQVLDAAHQLIPAYAQAGIPPGPFDQFKRDLLDAAHYGNLEALHFRTPVPGPQPPPIAQDERGFTTGGVNPTVGPGNDQRTPGPNEPVPKPPPGLPRT